MPAVCWRSVTLENKHSKSRHNKRLRSVRVSAGRIVVKGRKYLLCSDVRFSERIAKWCYIIPETGKLTDGTVLSGRIKIPAELIDVLNDPHTVMEISTMMGMPVEVVTHPDRVDYWVYSKTTDKFYLYLYSRIKDDSRR